MTLPRPLQLLELRYLYPKCAGRMKHHKLLGAGLLCYLGQRQIGIFSIANLNCDTHWVPCESTFGAGRSLYIGNSGAVLTIHGAQPFPC